MRRKLICPLFCCVRSFNEILKRSYTNNSLHLSYTFWAKQPLYLIQKLNSFVLCKNRNLGRIHFNFQWNDDFDNPARLKIMEGNEINQNR